MSQLFASTVLLYVQTDCYRVRKQVTDIRKWLEKLNNVANRRHLSIMLDNVDKLGGDGKPPSKTKSRYTVRVS